MPNVLALEACRDDGPERCQGVPLRPQTLKQGVADERRRSLNDNFLSCLGETEYATDRSCPPCRRTERQQEEKNPSNQKNGGSGFQGNDVD